MGGEDAHAVDKSWDAACRQLGAKKRLRNAEGLANKTPKRLRSESQPPERRSRKASGTLCSSQPHSLSLVHPIGCRECLRPGVKEGFCR
ncbi:hypothetical protein HBI56_086050 [Parastagonospora nodorum]|uniref:Uncharacterized protein n=1 Tax=Phaeosphaeria nodorum (strain SN15 / ATCC MYA-4574 / FGSC 10173) TaxID=321614 RepID=A0A7U2I7W1_PHANO|nr:hypothetical protein HBH56_113500 [Parastagonospora nodorum]QRD03592.1 hypothetical protein JI435_419920 [Parastagonospora nodorum SN15]KAH3921539.1 hypothetical protein HBH54_238920 [Parastagonospora nodorum]KAH3951031.1 hypothetical protein HBH53_069180 [Parastagonospora nodorum]KAH3962994.1 hypothetical protein HBH51_169850 [Parastagonospora nodorum]